MIHRLVILAAQGTDRSEEHVGHEQETDQVAQARDMARPQNLDAAGQQQHGDEELAVEIQERQEQGMRPRDPQVVLRMLMDHHAEAAGVFPLPGEALRDADAQHRTR